MGALLEKNTYVKFLIHLDKLKKKKKKQLFNSHTVILLDFQLTQSLFIENFLFVFLFAFIYLIQNSKCLIIIRGLVCSPCICTGTIKKNHNYLIQIKLFLRICSNYT